MLGVVEEQSQKVIRKQKKRKTKQEKMNESRLLTERLAEFLWLKHDKTRLTDNWDNETEQRKMRWITEATYIRQMVDDYYEE